MSFRPELCVYQQKNFMGIIHSFFIAHLNYLQAFLLSCPSTAILGEVCKLQVQFGFSCSRKHHPHECWEMPGAVLTNSFAGASSQTEQVDRAGDIHFHVFLEKEHVFQSQLLHGSRGNCSSEGCFVRFHPTATSLTISIKITHTQNKKTKTKTSKKKKKKFWLIIFFAHKGLGQGLYETGATEISSSHVWR